jgi:hypothetical protein
MSKGLEAAMLRKALVLVLFLSFGVLPQSADARPRGLGAILGVITNPVGAILGAARHAGRHSVHHHRSYARSHSSAPAAAGVAAGAAATAASSTPNPEAPATTTAVASPEPPAPQTKPATSEPSDDKSALVAPAASPPAAQTAAASVGSDAAPIRTSAKSGKPGLRLGMVGPAVWPSAFEDVVGYALWPADYADRLRGHGIGDVLTTAFTPGSALVARAHTGSKGGEDNKSTTGSGTASGICANAAAAAPDWPADDIERALTLNDAQRDALNDLKTAMTTAAASIRATCRDEAAPVDRLRALQNTLWAVHDAALLIREPLAKVYDSLTDEQKKQFAASAQADPRAAGRGDMARLCGMPTEHALPVQQLDQSLHIDKPQRASLDTLQKKSFEMGQFLMASCLRPVPATPTERLDAAAGRLTAVIFAASNVNMALNDFTSALSNEQKAKLNTLRR